MENSDEAVPFTRDVSDLGFEERSATRRDSTALDHPLRRRILNYVNRRPGIRFLDLCMGLDLNRGTAAYHLYGLRKEGFLASCRLGRTHRYYPTNQPPVVRGLHSLLMVGRIIEVVSTVQRHPGLTQVDLIQQLRMSRKTFRNYVDRLTNEGIIEETKDAKRRRYFPSKNIGPALAAHRLASTPP